MSNKKLALTLHPLTHDRWGDFESLFGERGACGGCWCMWWRLARSQYEKQKGEQNKRAMKKLVKAERIPGILAYADGRPIGWCAVAPRKEYPALQRSRILKPIDEQPVWSITCFFVDKSFRRKGVSVKLLQAAIVFVKKQGGKIVEGYPVEPKKSSMPDVFAFHGLSSAFLKAGFAECARRSETRPVMRYVIKK